MAEADWYPKREAKRFEPPPWEREQFEALQKQRAEEAPPEPEQPAEEAPAEVAAEPSQAAPQTESPASQPRPERKRDDLPPGVSQAQIDVMLAKLSAEEPKVDEHFKSVGLFASVVAMLLGVSMVAWGLYAMMTGRGRVASLVGALIVLGMGFVFGLTGLWVGWRATNKQGEK